MTFKAWEEIAPEPIRLPVGGKVYEVPPIAAGLGLSLTAVVDGRDQDAAAELGKGASLWAKLLGSAYDEMLADDVPVEVIARAGFTVLADFQYDRETAERVWESGLNPEARAAIAAAAREASPSAKDGD